MSALRQTLADGGPVVVAILVLSVILYTQGAVLIVTLLQAARRIRSGREAGAEAMHRLNVWRADLQEMFARQRVTLGAMIAAAPLLGLLGTVTGMIGTFHGIASHGTSKSMEGLAAGISEALIATKAGLSVAIPGVLMLYYAHRQLQRCLQAIALREHEVRGGG